MNQWPMRAVISALMALLLGGYGQTQASLADELLQRGTYLVHIMACGDCHTDGALAGRPDPARYLAGSRIGFEIPDLGIFYPPNLTPDAETGLGTWSTDDIVRAIREGERPDGRELAPIMPSRAAYRQLTDEDALALATYLKSITPVRHQVPDPVGPSEQPSSPYLKVIAPK